MEDPLPQVHRSTWIFMRSIYRRLYYTKSLTDWLSDMRRAHTALLGEDINVDRLLGQSIAILEYTIIVRQGHLPRDIAGLAGDHDANEGLDQEQGDEDWSTA